MKSKGSRFVQLTIGLICASQTAKAGIVAMTILAEARGEGEGMAAVAACIYQRSLNRKITPEQVCLQPKQFSCWNGKTKSDLEHLLKLSQAKTALWLEANLHRLNRAKIGYADHYHADYAKPYWADKSKKTIAIGKHIFYRLNTQ
jgi:spore germination cell wall hydrolase CwlJ-like protein